MAAIAGRPLRRERSLALSGMVLAALLAVVLAAATVDALVHLHMMTDQLGSVGQRLRALDDMSGKLDRLGPMQTTLERVDGRLVAVQGALGRTNRTLDATNTQLAATNARLDAALVRLRTTDARLGDMDRSLRGMSGEMRLLDRDLGSMRGDIHTMAHKLSGSFLFRGVK
ncbi:MAG: hypothetical protein QOD51_1459 [Candidatus Eremiobacteraeota bacterium]|jgi:septal ring factor EnvC (AmiA/AmiB activator)|nr:hypothetical protein [Candidatus Eremiobacteraeota bacterium]